MKVTIPTTREVNVKYITLELPVRYEEEDLARDAPMRDGDMWNISIDIDTGIILQWPKDNPLDLYMKVVDEGVYRLFDADWQELTSIAGYVPHGIVPGQYGDYVSFQIDCNGLVTNWPNSLSFIDFWPESQ